MCNKLAEMLGAQQAPGQVVRRPIRRALLRDASGKEVRVLYAGQEDTGSIERDLYKHAEVDGLDLNTAKLNLTEEAGQGIGRHADRGKRGIKPRR